MADEQSTNNPDSEFISEFNKYFSPHTTSVVNCPKKKGRRTSRRKSRAKKHAKTRGRTKRSKRSKIYNGGGFGGDIHLTPMMVPITNTQFDEFNRTFQNNMDCFITAIQMLGYIDLRTADLMRMTYNGIAGGFYSDQMDCIMMYLTNRNHDFRRCSSIEHWWQHITGVPGEFTGLAPGHAYIAGYLSETTIGHIFIIARASNPTEGTECNPVFPVYMIDVLGPSKRIIEINDSNFHTIMNDPSGDVRSFHIMYYNPAELLTVEQQQIVIGAIPTLRAAASMPAAVPAAVPAYPSPVFPSYHASAARAPAAESDEDVVESSYMARMRRLGLGP